MSRYIKNSEKSGIEIYFGEKPNDATLFALRLGKWRWHPAKGCWYNHDTLENEKFAKQICAVGNSKRSGAAASPSKVEKKKKTVKVTPKPKAKAEAKAKADAEARASKEAEATKAAETRAKADAEARLKAEAKAKAETEARIKAETKAKEEAEARIVAEAEAKIETEAREKAEAEAKAETEARARVEAEVKAQAEAREKALAKAKAEVAAKAKALRTLLKKPESPVFKERLNLTENVKTLDDAREMLVSLIGDKGIFGEDIYSLAKTLDSYKHNSDVAAEVIKSLFPPPQMAYDKFMGELADSDATFIRLICKGADIISVAINRTAKRDEILAGIIDDARSLSELCDDLATVLINKHGDSNNDDEATREIDVLLTDLQALIESVNNYS